MTPKPLDRPVWSDSVFQVALRNVLRHITFILLTACCSLIAGSAVAQQSLQVGKWIEGWNVGSGFGQCDVFTVHDEDMLLGRGKVMVPNPSFDPAFTFSNIGFMEFELPDRIFPKEDGEPVAKTGELLFFVSFPTDDTIKGEPLKEPVDDVWVDGEAAERIIVSKMPSEENFVIAEPTSLELWHILQARKTFEILAQKSTGKRYKIKVGKTPYYDFLIKAAEFKGCLGEIEGNKSFYRTHIDDSFVGRWQMNAVSRE